MSERMRDLVQSVLVTGSFVLIGLIFINELIGDPLAFA